jgi:hypothetical protein
MLTVDDNKKLEGWRRKAGFESIHTRERPTGKRDGGGEREERERGMRITIGNKVE